MTTQSMDALLASVRRPVLALLVLPLTYAACGNLTAGGLAEADVYVSGDHEPPAPAPSPSYAPVPLGASPLLADEADEAEGEVEIDFQIFLVTPSGRALRVGEEELRARVDLQGVTLDESVSNWPIQALRYTELRVVFTKIQAEVEGGLVINGLPVVGEVRVQLEDISLEVTRSVDLDVQEGQTVELVLDLNAPAWLTAVDPVTSTVDETVFASLMNVVVL